MSFEPGKPRHPQAGRRKGTPNKKTVELMTKLEELGLDPAEKLAFILDEQLKIFEWRKKKNQRAGALTALADAERTVADLMQYVYPKKKAIEHTGEVGVRTFADFIAIGSGGNDKS